MKQFKVDSGSGAARGFQYPQRILCDLKRPDFQSFLDLSRWLAAALVFVGHLRNPLFLGYPSLLMEDRNMIVQGWYFVTGWFGEAVIVFFVLSGFLVGGIGLAKLHSRRFDLVTYAIDRVTRLYVAFLPALLLTVLLDHAGHAWFPDAGLYTHTQPMIAEKINTPSFDSMGTPTIFVGNLVMLQNFLFPTYGSNTPLWTISAEFWFYFVFGLAAILLLHRSMPVWGAVIAMGAVVLTIIGTGFVYLLGLWLIGVAVALIGRSRLQQPLIALVLLLAVLIATRTLHDKMSGSVWGELVRDYGVAACFAYLVYSMRSAKSTLLVRLATFNRFMADFSFSLYLIHFPLLIFLSSLAFASGYFPGVATGYRPTDPQGLFLYVFLIVTVYLVAWGFSLATERHTARVRCFLNSIVSANVRKL